jgi:hypothetical protein
VALAGLQKELGAEMAIETAVLRPGDDERKKADAYFERGRIAAQTENFEYAIEMFITGLGLSADSLNAIRELRDLGLVRKARGGKDMGMFERRKLPRANDCGQKLLNGLNLMAYNPGDVTRLITVARAAAECGFNEVSEWAANLIEAANR